MFTIRKIKLQMNEEIMDKEVRLIGADGAMLGVMPVSEAQKLADSKSLDLVKIVPNATPPVCKIIDYGKSVFEQTKKAKEARKKQKIVELKEVRLSVKIEEHDFDFKAKSAVKFLQNGDKVKANIRFKGREIKFAVSGQDVLTKFAEAVKEAGVVERPPKLEGRSMSIILVPVKNK